VNPRRWQGGHPRPVNSRFRDEDPIHLFKPDSLVTLCNREAQYEDICASSILDEVTCPICLRHHGSALR